MVCAYSTNQSDGRILLRVPVWVYRVRHTHPALRLACPLIATYIIQIQTK